MYSLGADSVIANYHQAKDAGEKYLPDTNPGHHPDHPGGHHGGHMFRLDSMSHQNSMPNPDNLTLARSYVVYQQLGSVYNPADAHKHGTLFPELVRPYP
ncbi:MAG: spore coat associated protein CotJA [Peptococcaceae bacterium]|nr:spore coat associated protein CotJA [Peptococcaceae bacterium]MDR2736654.1 spore coat associated protein CotJA [Gracilibacteraceae bacterium]